MKNIIIFLSVLIIVFAAGCSKGVVCNAPYIQMGADCCLDQNSNKICDSDEGATTTLKEATTLATTVVTAQATTTTKETGELNPAFFDMPDTLVLGIADYTGIGDVPREFAAQILIPPIPFDNIYDINANSSLYITAVCHPGLSKGENSNYIYCEGKKTFPDKIGANGIVLRESGRYGITLILERTGEMVEIKYYRGGMFESRVLNKSFYRLS